MTDDVSHASLDDEETLEVVDSAFLTRLASGERMSVQHTRIESGATVDEHSHPHEQAVYVIRGEQTVTAGGETFVAGPGDSYVLPGGVSHGAENRGEEPALAVEVFSPPRTTLPWEDDGE